MPNMKYGEAIEHALSQAMSEDERIIIFGEDVEAIHLNLYGQFGNSRIKNTPISESAFVGAGITAAMAGLKPIVDVMIVDFIAVAMDAILNHASKVKTFSGGKWSVPLVIRSACGGGYGDGGQHEQTLSGWLAHIPGISVVMPSNPADAGGLMLAAIQSEDPVIFLEHKLLSEFWLKILGGSDRKNIQFDIPKEGAYGPVPGKWQAIPFGKADIKKTGDDITMVSVGVGVHRALSAANDLEKEGISCTVIDLRTISPLDTETIIDSVKKTNKLIVIDEDYTHFGLSGEVCAVIAEAGITMKFARVGVDSVIPYSRSLENNVLPSKERIMKKVYTLLN